MNSDLRILLYPLAGPHVPGGQPWEDRLSAIGEILKSDGYDFIILPGLTVPDPGQGTNMLVDLVDFMPDYSFFYTRHLPNIQDSEGLAMCHRHRRWEADLASGFRLWPPNTDRALFCILYHELDGDQKRTGRAVYVASCQSRDDEGLDIMREAIAMQMNWHLSKRPHPQYPVIWAGDVAMDEDSALYRYVTGHTTDIADEKDSVPAMAFQDPMPILHPGAPKAATVNNWRDVAPGGGVRRDFIFLSEGLTPKALDFNYLRTQGGLFPSNHFPQRAVVSFETPGEKLH